MRDEMFNELLTSVQEMYDIVRGQNAPARAIEFLEPEVELIREQNLSEPKPRSD